MLIPEAQCNVLDLQLYQARAATLEREILEQEHLVSEQREILAQAQAQFGAAAKGRKLIEIIKERHREAYRRRLARTEENEREESNRRTVTFLPASGNVDQKF